MISVLPGPKLKVKAVAAPMLVTKVGVGVSGVSSLNMTSAMLVF
jgi:hypothetical protein